MSADPLAVHAPGAADLNLYAYVRGQVLKNVDPLGLKDEAGDQARATIAQGEQQLSALGREREALLAEHGALQSVPMSGTEQDDLNAERMLEIEDQIAENDQMAAEVSVEVAAAKQFLNDRPVLGIHSNVAGDKNGFASGHAWLSVSRGGQTKTVGLWPDRHPDIKDKNPWGTDVRTGMEDAEEPAASRYYALTPSEEKRLNATVKQHATWGDTNNCSSWASETTKTATGADVDADDWLGLETPRELGASIQKLEVQDPSSPQTPTSVR